MRKMLGIALALAASALMAACGANSPISPETATSAAQVAQTAAAIAPTVQAQAGTLQETAVALATESPIDIQAAQQTAAVLVPTLQAQSPELRATLEALATQVPGGSEGALQTLQSLTGGAGAPAGIPIAQPSQMIVSSPTHVTYTTTQLPADVVTFYKTEMVKAGWAESSGSASSGDASQLQFSMGAQTATVRVVRVGEATTVDISLEG